MNYLHRELKELIKTYTRPFDGLLALRERGLRSRIDRIDQDIQRQEQLVEQKSQALVGRFSRLQANLGSLQQQQQYVSAALGGGGGNPVSQLLSSV